MNQERLIRPISDVLEDLLPTLLVDLDGIQVHAPVALLAAPRDEPLQVGLLVGAGARDPRVLDAVEGGLGGPLALLRRPEVEDPLDPELPAQHRLAVVGEVVERAGPVDEAGAQGALGDETQVARVERPVDVHEGWAEEHRAVVLLGDFLRYVCLGEFAEVCCCCCTSHYNLYV